MSIILKGIDLPPNSKVQIIVESPIESFRKQIPKSRIIQIPKDHGRLIDADRFLQNFRPAEELPEDPYYMGAEDVLEDLRHTATILEAGE